MAHYNTVFAQMLKFIPTCLSLPAAGRRRSTTSAAVPDAALIKTAGLSGCVYFLHRHSSESSPAWMQVVEPRLEQAAEESRKAMTGC